MTHQFFFVATQFALWKKMVTPMVSPFVQRIQTNKGKCGLGIISTGFRSYSVTDSGKSCIEHLSDLNVQRTPVCQIFKQETFTE